MLRQNLEELYAFDKTQSEKNSGSSDFRAIEQSEKIKNFEKYLRIRKFQDISFPFVKTDRKNLF